MLDMSPQLSLRMWARLLCDDLTEFVASSGGQYMAEVLETVCQKRRIINPKDYALVLDLKNQKLFIPLDRTVKSLQGNRDLMLIKKSMLQNYGVDMGKRNTARSTDPNGTYIDLAWGYVLRILTCPLASIVKRASDVPEQIYSSMFDYTSAYKVGCISIGLNNNSSFFFVYSVTPFTVKCPCL